MIGTLDKIKFWVYSHISKLSFWLEVSFVLTVITFTILFLSY